MAWWLVILAFLAAMSVDGEHQDLRSAIRETLGVCARVVPPDLNSCDLTFDWEYCMRWGCPGVVASHTVDAQCREINGRVLEGSYVECLMKAPNVRDTLSPVNSPTSTAASQCQGSKIAIVAVASALVGLILV